MRNKPLHGFGAVLLIAGIGLAGCAKKDERVFFDGNYYPSKARAVSKDDRQEFSVAVRRVDQGLAGARQAGRHGGTEYCLKNFGTSDIEWIVGPDAPDAALGLPGSSLTMRGSCVLW